jgi:hypothetical protein
MADVSAYRRAALRLRVFFTPCFDALRLCIKQGIRRGYPGTAKPFRIRAVERASRAFAQSLHRIADAAAEKNKLPFFCFYPIFAELPRSFRSSTWLSAYSFRLSAFGFRLTGSYTPTGASAQPLDGCSR